MNCVFCKIINGDIPSYTIYEDEIVKVFLDIDPDVDGHLLIIPKQHILDMDTIDDETLSYIMIIAKKMKKLLKDKLGIDGLTIIQNNGSIQEVKHYHIHLKPHYKNEQKLNDVNEIFSKLMK